MNAIEQEDKGDAAIQGLLPPYKAVSASRPRWREATFQAPLTSYRGVGLLVRNFLKSPHKWKLEGKKSYKFLRDHLMAEEPHQSWSRAVSSECALEKDPAEATILVAFGEAAAALATHEDQRVQRSGLQLLAAISSDNGDGIATARKILAEHRDRQSQLLGAALEVCGWCFRTGLDLQAFYSFFESTETTWRSALAMSRILILREDALKQIPSSRIQSWCEQLRSLLAKRGTGIAASLPVMRATEAIAYLLRRRIWDRAFLAPGSALHQRLRCSIVEQHDHLRKEDESSNRQTCAAMRRLVRYLDGQGCGDVICALVHDENELEPTEQAAPEAPVPASPPPPAVRRPQPSQQPPKIPMQPDADQIRVIEAPANSFIQVAAPPGAGKTAVACSRVAWLARNGIPPAGILMISFTRVAVAEFRERIQKMAQDVSDIHGVEITTLDSQAWRILQGLDEGSDVEQLFGSFEANIETTTQRICDGDQAIVDWIRHYRHIIVDEAQDLVGARAKLVASILKMRAPQTGATIFADAAQAIYGFTTDDDGTGATDSFFEVMKQHGLRPVHCELKTIHRTKNPKLQALFIEGRKPLFDHVAEPNEAWSGARLKIQELADENIKDFDDLVNIVSTREPLVLFRTRAQVLVASSMLQSKGIHHRIRMSGTPQAIEPWIGFLLAETDGSLLPEDEFQDLWSAHESHPCLTLHGRSMDSAWSALREIAPGKKNGVSLPRLRNQLSRHRPPVGVAIPEVGHQGAILGTIHASKGREASEVVLMLPKNGGHEDSDLLEEGRVLYVGATRAIDRLTTGDSFACHSGILDSGRVYRGMKSKKGSKFTQCELGREGDLDPASSVALTTQTDEQECRAVQQWLADHVATDSDAKACQIGDGDWDYQIRIEDERVIGSLNQQFNHDLFKIGGKSKRPPSLIPHLRVCGATTTCLAPDDPRLAELHEPYATSGIFLSPIVRGMVPIFFKSSFKKGGQW